MPCTLANNVRFISAEDQLQSTSGHASRNRRSSGLIQSTAPQCPHLIGKKPHLIRQIPRNIKPEHHKYVKAIIPTISVKEQERLVKAAKFMTVEERLDALAKKEELSKLQAEQTERTRNYFRQIDEIRKKQAEAEAMKAEPFLGGGEKEEKLELAFIAKHEQEDEVRAVNRFILHAKCQAIRDMQIKEKRRIEEKQRDEQIRLEKMVIKENDKALAMEDYAAINRKDRNTKYANEIREQLIQRENMRFIEAERAEKEAEIQRRANDAMLREEQRKMLEAKERREKFHAELDRVVEMSNMFKRMLCDQEREADLRITAYTKEKREREKRLEQEKQLARDEFERKQKLLYQLAQKLMASKTEREELNLMREQEHAEREYRRREREAALRRKQLEDEIRESRERQMQEMKTRQALQIAREEKEFNEMIESLQKEEQRLKKEEELREHQRECHRQQITRQMKDKAESRRRLLEYEISEANLIREAERKRLANVRAVVGAKLAAMREACLPEHYIKDIERLMDRVIKREPK